MYNNVGKKIKIIAIVFAICVAIASVITGLCFITTGGIVLILAGPLVAWLSSLMTYGFGQIVESIQNIEKKIVFEESIEEIINNNVVEDENSVLNKEELEILNKM